MKQYDYYTILSNDEIAAGIFDMTVLCPGIAMASRAGQFANVFLDRPEHLLARPLSLCEIDKAAGTIRIVYRVAGKGTEYISKLSQSDSVRLLAPLGNGFEVGSKESRIALIGGGIGAPPLLELAKQIAAQNPSCETHVFLGFRSEPFLIKDFVDTGSVVHISTDDGSEGFHGNVTQDLERIGLDYELIYACGPKAMLQSVARWADKRGTGLYVSMEERMACGVGACVGCAIKIKDGDGYVYKKVCVDGPVFDAREVCFE